MSDLILGDVQRGTALADAAHHGRQELLRIADCCAQARVSRTTIERLIKSRRIEAVRVGTRSLRIVATSWDRFLAGGTPPTAPVAGSIQEEDVPTAGFRSPS